MLAAHSGLAEYGNNGITYTKEFGSYFRLSTFASDYPYDSDVLWKELSLMKYCQKCEKCIQACPGKAITRRSQFSDWMFKMSRSVPSEL
ncbi:MAG TPA: hypothetical protein PKY18_07720 [Dictyoglomaceae bacterium]|nr:hypothetical protein [Dictyoglomaceae bacterium]HPP16360.1 hypothetical protein [Dictyoglomaceae bacterium]